MIRSVAKSGKAVPATHAEEGRAGLARREAAVGRHTVLGRFLQTAVFEKRTFGGCDENDVMAKLEGLSALYEAEIACLREELARERERASAFEKQAEEVRRVLAAARSAKDDMERRAERTAKNVIVKAVRDGHLTTARAEAEAESLLRGARKEAEELRDGAARAHAEVEQRRQALDERERRFEDGASQATRQALDALAEAAEELAEIAASLEGSAFRAGQSLLASHARPEALSAIESAWPDDEEGGREAS